jgi:hypothetical protein
MRARRPHDGFTQKAQPTRYARSDPMPLHQALASYLPESMLITLSPAVSLLDSAGNLVGFSNPLSFSYFFHEYVHYLHNISTVSGIGAFINTVELWRTFRITIDDTGLSEGSAALSRSQQDHLATLRAVLNGTRGSNPPATNITNPTKLRINSIRPEAIAKSQQGDLVTVLICDAEVSDSSNTESCVVQLGTLELLEGVAWLLEKRAAQAVDPTVAISEPPVFPYRVVEAAIDHAVPGLSEEAIICCVLSALQSTDAPDAFLQLLDIAKTGVAQGDPVGALRRATVEALHQNQAQIESVFARLENEFNGSGIFASTMQQVVGTARAALQRRLVDPFFEFTLIEEMKTTPDAFANAIERIAPCASLQQRPGGDDDVMRDLLLTFAPQPKAGGLDIEAGQRVMHCIFHFIRCHRSREGFVQTSSAPSLPCPFYTCCNLQLRQSDPAICKCTPWKSADWHQWDAEKGACWYGTGVRLTRPPKV